MRQNASQCQTQWQIFPLIEPKNLSEQPAPPLTPPWASLPVEVRQQTVRLLVRLLRQHRRRVHAGIVEREACDE
jgi:hypothetical protein